MQLAFIMMKQKNIFSNLHEQFDEEIIENLVNAKSIKVERIISKGHASPLGFWYDQDWHEWVCVLEGYAILEFDNDESDLVLGKGDYVLIPAHKKHRVKWTDPNRHTLWLAIYYS